METKTYDVVWGKRTNKKHKTYEGDGIIRICGKLVSLCDNDGNLISSSTTISVSSIEEGAVVSIGANDVQVLEPVHDSVKQNVLLKSVSGSPNAVKIFKFNENYKSSYPFSSSSPNKTALIKTNCKKLTSAVSFRTDSNIKVTSDAIRSTTAILDLLSNEQEHKESCIEISSEAIETLPPARSFVTTENLKCTVNLIKTPIENRSTCIKSTTPMTLYNVIWGKRSNKKHKTFEGDGTLEITSSKSAILRDNEGVVLGRAENLNTGGSLLEDGKIISVGSKDVQILEVANGASFAKSTSAATLKSADLTTSIIKRNLNKPYKRKSFNAMHSNTDTNAISKRGHFNLDFQQLVLPEPSEEHQWSHNASKHPITPVSVDPHLARVLRPHQRDGVVFLYRCVMGYLPTADYNDDSNPLGPGPPTTTTMGAILADEMGLGKTLQCVTLVWTLLKRGPYGGTPSIKRAIVVAPSSLCANWCKEFYQWLGRERMCVFLVDAKNKPRDYAKMTNAPPVLVISYEMVSRYITELETIPFDLLICDEGHRLKNTSIKINTQLAKLACRRRVIATGTPIQNDLSEFYALVDFVNPGVLGSVNEFRNRYQQPIMLSQQLNCDVRAKETGEARARELHERTSRFILRRTQDVIDMYLPKKQENVIVCRMTDLQNRLYRAALEFYEKSRGESSDLVVHLQLIACLKKICNHPLLLLSNDASGNDTGTDDGSGGGLLKAHLSKIMNGKEVKVSDSGKLKIIESLLRAAHRNDEKIVLVSYFTRTLDVLADLCAGNGYVYTRLDGSTPSGDRQKLIDQFNSPYSNTFVFLLSAKAGGVGLNITGASRLVLFDTDWNPATDLQAMSRIWRDGQKKSVYIYRLLIAGTIEEKMHQRQMFKTSLSGAVVDMCEENSKLKLSSDELKEIFTLNEDTCTTHDMLQCMCECDGTIPATAINEYVPEESNANEGRPCQLTLKTINDGASKKSLRMHELLKWEHHKHPVAEETLKSLGLKEASQDILFIFRNQGSCKL